MSSSKFELDGLGPSGQGPFQVPIAQSVRIKEGSDVVELSITVMHRGEPQQVLVTIPNRFGYQLAGVFRRAATTDAVQEAAKG
jgi:hypothetical protein